jgi:nicotinate-nucleotide adenylyltransferase
MNETKRIGLIGGTFDPIHVGHLAVAESARNELGLDAVVFIPAGSPPHKSTDNISLPEHRFLMTAMAVNDNSDFSVSKTELNRSGVSFTVDTVREISETSGDNAELVFIVGADTLFQVPDWKDADRLFAMCSFAVAVRPGYEDLSLDELISSLRESGCAVSLFDAPSLDISSSDLRARVRAGKSIKYLVPDAVSAYIRKNSLYVKPLKYDKTSAQVLERVKETVSPERFIHTLNVCGEAVRLAKRYGEDPERAYLAALLHDNAKGLSTSRSREMMERRGACSPELREMLSEWPKIAHAFVGAEIAARDFMVDDMEILDAVRFHTTGRAGMSLLEKIIYIADYIEPGRDFPGVERLRRLAYENIDAAMAAALRQSVEDMESCGNSIHRLSVEALDYFEK